ncbi:MAG: tetratricopeptide repeat protein [Anaerolineae bacterium]|nr:tetratricopeptide repeat protein [Anaerolineae bacterium]MDQ7036794.1 tetratricopeptide repeat protein [Anaerolineae bacterium]
MLLLNLAISNRLSLFTKEAIEIAKSDNADNAKEDEALRRGDYGRFLALTNKPKPAAIEIQQAQHDLSELGLTIESALQWGNAGLAYAALNQHEKALEQYNIALPELETTPHSAMIRANRADSYLALSKYDEAQADYDAALTTARETNNLIVVVQALIGLARLHLESGTLENAEHCLNEAESIIRRANLRRLQAHLLTVHSRLYIAQGDKTKAQSVWDEATKLRSILRMPNITSDWLFL